MLRYRLTSYAFVVVLSTLTGVARLAAADRPEPTDEKLLFEGPIAGTAVFRPPLASVNQELTGTILYVTKEAIFIRPNKGTAVRVIDTPRHTLSYAIAMKDGKKLIWDWDETRKEIKGYSAAPNTPAIPASTAAGKSEPKYLFFALERLQERVDQAVTQNDVPLLKQLADRAEVVKEYAEKERFDPKIVRLYAEMPEYIEKQKRLAKERAEFLDQHMVKVEENSIKDREAAMRAEMVKTKGLGEYFRGAFPRVTVYSGRWWWGYGPYASASYDFGGAMAGVATIIRGQQQYELESLRIRFAKSLLDMEKARALDALNERQQKVREARQRQLADAGAEMFSLPKSKDSLETRERAADLQSKGDFQSLLDVLERRASAERKGDDQANPFTLLDTYHTASQLEERSRQEQADKLFDLAQKAVDAVRYVPPGPVYDPDRADVLRTAGGLACMAAMLDSPDESWRAAYSPKASYAVRLLERAKTIHLDQGGQVREQLAVAYALAGRPAEAARMANQIKGSRKGSVAFLITLVRLMAINENHKDAMDVLQDAINQGYNDVSFIGKNEDFNALRRDNRYTAFTKPQFSVFWVVPKALQPKQQKSRFEIVNNSPFPLTDVRLTMKVEIRGETRPLTFTKTIPQVEKGEKIDWEELFAEPPQRVWRLQVSIDTDQGKYSTDRPTKK